jgi:CubicO group peptidase (beta-lactamase class C family)
MNGRAGETMISQPMLRPLRAVAIMTTLATALLTACSASSAADKRDAALDAVIPAAMQKASVPGAIVGIWQDGRAPYVRAFGVRDTATRQPMATDLSMRIGSTSKTFTVTAILMLADQGKLGLDDPIDRYVTGVPSGNEITLRQLAAMRSGLYNYSDDTNPKLPQQPLRQWTPRELLAIAFRHPLLFPPGSDFDYCNTNTVLLGMVVEKVSGQSLASFIEQNILKPESMTRTVFPAGAEFPSPHAQGYFKLPDGKVVDATDWNPSWGWASGNMISTARRHARVGARPRHRQVDLAGHEARARPVLAGAPGRRGRALRAGDREPERLGRPQRQHYELHGLPLLPPGRADHGLVDHDARHHPDHPRMSLTFARTAGNSPPVLNARSLDPGLQCSGRPTNESKP